MRVFVLATIVFVAACRSVAVPLGGDGDPAGSGGAAGSGAGGGGGIVGDPDLGVDPNACSEPDGSVVRIGGDLAVAQELLPARWGLCSRSSDTFGPWSPAALAGVEFVADDSVTQAQAGGGRWYFLTRAADGTVARGQGFGAEGTFLYNPLPGDDWEQISMSSGGQYADFTVAFTDGPRKLRLVGPSSWTAIFAPLP